MKTSKLPKAVRRMDRAADRITRRSGVLFEDLRATNYGVSYAFVDGGFPDSPKGFGSVSEWQAFRDTCPHGAVVQRTDGTQAIPNMPYSGPHFTYQRKRYVTVCPL